MTHSCVSEKREPLKNYALDPFESVWEIVHQKQLTLCNTCGYPDTRSLLVAYQHVFAVLGFFCIFRETSKALRK